MTVPPEFAVAIGFLSLSLGMTDLARRVSCGLRRHVARRNPRR